MLAYISYYIRKSLNLSVKSEHYQSMPHSCILRNIMIIFQNHFLYLLYICMYKHFYNVQFYIYLNPPWQQRCEGSSSQSWQLLSWQSVIWCMIAQYSIAWDCVSQCAHFFSHGMLIISSVRYTVYLSDNSISYCISYRKRYRYDAWSYDISKHLDNTVYLQYIDAIIDNDSAESSTMASLEVEPTPEPAQGQRRSRLTGEHVNQLVFLHKNMLQMHVNFNYCLYIQHLFEISISYSYRDNL